MHSLMARANKSSANSTTRNGHGADLFKKVKVAEPKIVGSTITQTGTGSLADKSN